MLLVCSRFEESVFTWFRFSCWQSENHDIYSISTLLSLHRRDRVGMQLKTISLPWAERRRRHRLKKNEPV